MKASRPIAAHAHSWRAFRASTAVPMRARVWVFPLAAAVLLGGACKSSHSAGGHNTVTAVACSTDADCANGDVCDSGYCLTLIGTSCASNADCATGDACDVAAGQCVAGGLGCASDADCATGEVCDGSGSCVPGSIGGCTSDADCASGETCDTNTGTCSGGSSGGCVASGGACSSNSDCCTMSDGTSGLCSDTFACF